MDDLAAAMFRYIADPSSYEVGSTALFARFAAEKPIIRHGPVWIISRYDLVTRLASDPRCTSELPDGWQGNRPMSPAVTAITEKLLPVLPAAEHRRLRRLVAAEFGARSVGQLRDRVDKIVDDLLAEPLARGECEVVSDLGVPLPVFTTAAMLGLPDEDRGRVLGWSEALNEAIKGQFPGNFTDYARPDDPAADGPGAPADSTAALNRVIGYIEELVSQRQRTPGTDLISRLSLTLDAEDGKLTHEELVNLVVLLFMTGIDTVGGALVNVIMALCRHPEVWQRVIDDPGLAGNAYSEAARLYPAVPMMSRATQADIELGNVVIPAGSMVILVYAAANLDPAVFSDPLQFDLHRVGQKALTFGHGPHYCLGAGVALLQGETVLRKLAERSPSFTMIGEPGPRRPEHAFHSVANLRLRLPDATQPLSGVLA
jgi:cytochrome P450